MSGSKLYPHQESIIEWLLTQKGAEPISLWSDLAPYTPVYPVVPVIKKFDGIYTMSKEIFEYEPVADSNKEIAEAVRDALGLDVAPVLNYGCAIKAAMERTMEEVIYGTHTVAQTPMPDGKTILAQILAVHVDLNERRNALDKMCHDNFGISLEMFNKILPPLTPIKTDGV
jgi:hypothetical protein